LAQDISKMDSGIVGHGTMICLMVSFFTDNYLMNN